MHATTFAAGRLRARHACRTGLIALALALSAHTLHAEAILAVTGPSTLGHIIQSNQAAAVSFTLERRFDNVTATADLTASSRRGGIFLMRDLGPSAGFADIVAAVNLEAITFAGSATVLFSGLSLSPGHYALVVASDQSSPNSTLIWNGSRSAQASAIAATGVVIGPDLFANSTDVFPPASRFNAVFDRAAHFSLLAPAIPEPPSLVMMFAGLGWLWARRRFASKRALTGVYSLT